MKIRLWIIELVPTTWIRQRHVFAPKNNHIMLTLGWKVVS